MECEILTPVVGLLCGVMGYFIRSIIDRWKHRKDIVDEYQHEDLKAQKELLVEFLGPIWSDFNILLQVGDTYDVDWRIEKSNLIYDWVIRNKLYFPSEIRKSLTWFGNLAGTLVQEQTLITTRETNTFSEASRRHDQIQDYFDEIRSKLEGKYRLIMSFGEQWIRG